MVKIEKLFFLNVFENNCQLEITKNINLQLLKETIELVNRETMSEEYKTERTQSFPNKSTQAVLKRKTHKISTEYILHLDLYSLALKLKLSVIELCLEINQQQKKEDAPLASEKFSGGQHSSIKPKRFMF